MRIILLSLPGAGKETQGKKLAKFYNISYYSLRDAVRAEFASQTELSKRIATSWGNSRNWQPLPDAIAIELATPILQKRDWILVSIPNRD